MTLWYVGMGGELTGPYEEPQLIELLEQGKVSRNALVRVKGTDEWLKVSTHPRFSSHVRGSLLPPSGAHESSRKSLLHPSHWLVMSAIGSLVMPLVAVAGLGWLSVRFSEHAEREKQLAEKIDVLSVELRESRAATWIDAGEVMSQCHALSDRAECWVTNVRPKAITTCLGGRLIKREAEGVRLESGPMCTGAIEPQKTVVVSAAWKGGLAKDICFAKRPPNLTILDWEKCRFESFSVDLRASGASK